MTHAEIDRLEGQAMAQQNLFDITEPPKPRQPRRIMMHVTDAGPGECSIEGEHIATFECSKCGHVTGWLIVKNITEGKRGVPCPKCNPSI